ncbi:uncharacterized protein LOC112094257 [Morus notabilis]|uniref:uncharacterized protein LOC112094257 n=1 Tax=Morus notabilis TaxID=981085 RepID=UPI000CED3C02|nr:uncharacterized protein LOC112094257 [Morus notabilis]
MDFLMGLSRTELKHDAIWVVVDRLMKSAHFIPFRATYSQKILSELYLEHIVRLHGVPLSITSDRDTRFNASYQASIGMAPFEALYGRPFRSPEGDFVLLKVSPCKGVVRFGVKGKLAPRYVGPFLIVQRIGVVAYRLALPPELSHYDASYEEALVQILDRKIKSLRHCEIPLVKVSWQHHGVEEATWELETMMQEQYPYLFTLCGRL